MVGSMNDWEGHWNNIIFKYKYTHTGIGRKEDEMIKTICTRRKAWHVNANRQNEKIMKKWNQEMYLIQATDKGYSGFKSMG